MKINNKPIVSFHFVIPNTVTDNVRERFKQESLYCVTVQEIIGGVILNT